MKSRSEQEDSQINAKQSHIDYHKNENQQIAHEMNLIVFFSSPHVFIGGYSADEPNNKKKKQNGNTKKRFSTF